jgi:hypothetical protein
MDERQYIKEAIYDWVSAVVKEEGRSEPVIWDHDDGPRPVPPFVSLEFTGTNTPGSPDYSMVDVDPEKPNDNGVQIITRFVRRALTMYGFGDGAVGLLEQINDSIYKDAYIAMLALKGLVIPQALEVTENPATRGISVENSAFFEFYVTYTRAIKDSPGWIGTVHIKPEGLPMEEITNQEENANG